MKLPLIVSARLQEPTQQELTALRYRYFPSNRYVLPAHLTLFHAIPYAIKDELNQALATLSCRDAPEAQLVGLRALGKGFAVAIKAPVLQQLHGTLREQLSDQLTPQDNRPLQPHVTLQNKVDPSQAKADMADAQATFVPSRCAVVSLCLWQYQGGPWELLQEHQFAAVGQI